MHRIIFSAQIFILLLFSGCNDQSSLEIDDLSCENLTDPVGIGTNVPRLSWKLRSDKNGAAQKAYQVIAASDTNLLYENKADLWNSEKISSPASILIPYGGGSPGSKSLCYWKVRVWDQKGKISDWSKTAFFSIGLLKESDWKARYIGLQDTKNGISPLLRKSVNITDKGEKIFIHVNSLGYHELYVNGSKAGKNVLVPAVSQYNKRSLSVTYDITPYITQGRNDIIIWAGKGWYSKGLPGVIFNGPLVRAQAERYKNGRWETIFYTDSLWLARNSGYTDTGTWRPGEFGGEAVDGTMVLTDLKASSVDQAVWNRAIVKNVPEHMVSPQTTERDAIVEDIRPSSIKKTGEDTWVIDMGKTLTGWFEITFPQLKDHQEIIMEYCDHFDNDGKFVDQGQKDLYLAAGKAGESFKNKFNYHGFRYVKISNLETEPSPNDIKSSRIRTDYNLSSSFACSDTDLNRIHDMIFYTLQCLSLGGYLVDCPQIERLGYGGDGNASTETAQVMYDLGPLYTNWLQAWADCIRDDGGMPHTAPNPYPAGGGPYWCGFIITASWKTYQNYGDINVLEKYYPVMQKWLGYVEKYSPSGLLEPWPETDYRGWYLGDWASPEGVDQTNPASIELVNNSFIAVCYETMQKIAGVLGRKEDAVKYSDKNKMVKKLIQEKLFDKSKMIYGSGSQIDLTFPLLAEIVPDSVKDRVRNNLYNEIRNVRKGNIACGLVGIPVFTEWAVREHEADLMYSILKKRDYPGYLYMIDNGATTTWEHWNGARSRIHNCYNGIGSWFYEAVGGIRKDEGFPGYQNMLIDPQVPAGVTWAKTSKETPYGNVSVKWKLEKNTFDMEINIPVGCTASIKVPDGGTGIKLNGRSIRTSESWVPVESGEYSFRCSLNNNAE